MTSVEQRIVPCRNCRTNCSAEDNFCARCGVRLQGATTSLITLDERLGKTSRAFPWSSRLLVLVSVLFFAAGLLTLTVSLQRSASSPVTAPPEGFVWFYNVHKQNDAVAFRLRALPPLAKGESYIVWLSNPQRPDQVLPIGPLTLDTHGYVAYASDHHQSVNPHQLDLRLLFTTVWLTVERTSPHYLRPLGRVVLQGKLAAGTRDAITLSAPVA